MTRFIFLASFVALLVAASSTDINEKQIDMCCCYPTADKDTACVIKFHFVCNLERGYCEPTTVSTTSGLTTAPVTSAPTSSMAPTASQTVTQAPSGASGTISPTQDASRTTGVPTAAPSTTSSSSPSTVLGSRLPTEMPTMVQTSSDPTQSPAPTPSPTVAPQCLIVTEAAEGAASCVDTERRLDEGGVWCVPSDVYSYRFSCSGDSVTLHHCLNPDCTACEHTPLDDQYLALSGLSSVQLAGEGQCLRSDGALSLPGAPSSVNLRCSASPCPRVAPPAPPVNMTFLECPVAGAGPPAHSFLYDGSPDCGETWVDTRGFTNKFGYYAADEQGCIQVDWTFATAAIYQQCNAEGTRVCMVISPFFDGQLHGCSELNALAGLPPYPTNIATANMELSDSGEPLGYLLNAKCYRTLNPLQPQSVLSFCGTDSIPAHLRSLLPASDRTCAFPGPLGNFDAAPAPLSFCSSFADQACCTSESDAFLSWNASLVADRLGGTSSECYSSFKHLVCSYTCSPRQFRNLYIIALMSENNFTVQVNQLFAEEMFSMCTAVNSTLGSSLLEFLSTLQSLVAARVEFVVSASNGIPAAPRAPTSAPTAGGGPCTTDAPTSASLGTECPFPGPAGTFTSAPVSLQFCSSFSDKACCNTTEDAVARREMTSILTTSTFGGVEHACWRNFKALTCGFTCAPDLVPNGVIVGFKNQTDQLDPVTGQVPLGVHEFVVQVNAQFADAFYDSCKDVPPAPGTPVTWSDLAVTSAKFLELLVPSAKPDWRPTVETPPVNFVRVESGGFIAQMGTTDTMTSSNGEVQTCKPIYLSSGAAHPHVWCCWLAIALLALTWGIVL